MSDSMVDRAQQAISLLPRQPRDSEEEFYWRQSVVRTVIEAMREPSEAMAREGFEQIWNREVYCRDDPLHTVEMQTTAGKTAWQAMISAALAEE